MTIDIYDAEPSDIPEIYNLIQLVIHESKKSRILNRLYSKDALSQAIDSENRHLIVAIVDDEIVGVCQYGIPIMDDCDCEDLRMIQALFVHPEANFPDVASALVYDVEESINTEAGVQRLSVFVEGDNLPQIKFYAGLGFTHDQVEDVGDEWYMEKDL